MQNSSDISWHLTAGCFQLLQSTRNCNNSNLEFSLRIRLVFKVSEIRLKQGLQNSVTVPLWIILLVLQLKIPLLWYLRSQFCYVEWSVIIIVDVLSSLEGCGIKDGFVICFCCFLMCLYLFYTGKRRDVHHFSEVNNSKVQEVCFGITISPIPKLLFLDQVYNFLFLVLIYRDEQPPNGFGLVEGVVFLL